MSRVHLTQQRTPSVSPPPASSTWRHRMISPPIEPERSIPPTSSPHQHPHVLISPPTSHPGAVVISAAPRDPYSLSSRHSSSGSSSRSSSQASTNRSLSPPLSRSTSPSSCSSRASSTSRKSVSFAEKPEYAPSERLEGLTVGGAGKGWEYVSSRGMQYHRDEYRGRDRELRDMDSLVVEKARRGGREGRRRRVSGEEVEGGRDRYY